MSAMPQSQAMRPIERMHTDDIAEVLAIEEAVYPFPWTLGNFQDSIKSAYQAWIMRSAAGELTGYFLLMPVVDEGHLLNITVRADLHGQGWGRWLLDRVVEIARQIEIESILLEVRPSNQRALKVYEQYGFRQIGRRRDYYPAPAKTREDAIVMRLSL
jgi:ribosomal-protein-alanine N-acetyltransferase